MKRILTTCALACVLLLAACNGKNDPSNKLRGNAMLYINVEQSTARAETPETSDNNMDNQKLLTPKEIVEQAYGFIFDDMDGVIDGRLGVLDSQRDVENARIKMWGTDIITEDGELEPYFMNAKNIKIVGLSHGTGVEPIIAYIPNKTITEAWEKVQAAYNAGNYDEVYKLFEDAYTAIPTTTAEYNKLKEKGEH